MAHSVETPYQGVAIRFVQYLIDAIILGIVSSFVTVPFRSSVSVNTTTGTVSIGPGYGFGIAIAFIIELLYFTLLSGRYAQSVGMMAVRIKVVREADFGKISYGAALARTIFLLIDAIPFVIPYLIGAILIWSSDKKQRLGDRVARTVVIKT
ncbi:MAG: RDD family protein [Halobacteriota archaeon]